MKISLRDVYGNWIAFEGTVDSLKNELNKRNISIGNNAHLGYGAHLGNNARIGDYADIGNNARIGDYAHLGYGAHIGDGAHIGNNARIGYGARIGDYADIGNNAYIGDYAHLGYGAHLGNNARIGDYADIGNNARIGNNAHIGNNFNKDNADIFSALNILVRTGVVIQNGKGIFYKCVRPDLKDFYSGTHQYVIGKGAKLNHLYPDQSKRCAESIGEGFHFGSYWYAVNFLRKREGIIISAEIDIKDILAVHDKIRVRAYDNVQIVDIPLK